MNFEDDVYRTLKFVNMIAVYPRELLHHGSSS